MKVTCQRGMTLIEILVAVSLLGTLSGVLLKSISGSLEAGRKASTKLFAIGPLKNVVARYEMLNNGKRPQRAIDIINYFDEKNIPKDAWGESYNFHFTQKLIIIEDSKGNKFDTNGNIIGDIPQDDEDFFSHPPKTPLKRMSLKGRIY